MNDEQHKTQGMRRLTVSGDPRSLRETLTGEWPSDSAGGEPDGPQQQAIIHIQLEKLESAVDDAERALVKLHDRLDNGGVLSPQAVPPADKKGDRALEVPMAEHLRGVADEVRALEAYAIGMIARLGV
jgi:hypothetical protein